MRAMTEPANKAPPPPPEADQAAPPAPHASAPLPKPPPGEIGGPSGPEPTRYGDWERKGRVSDF